MTIEQIVNKHVPLLKDSKLKLLVEELQMKRKQDCDFAYHLGQTKLIKK